MENNLLDKDRQKVAQFLQAAESGAVQSGLSGPQREKINEFVVDQRNNYVNAAMIINSGRFSKSSPAYLEAVQSMNRVKSNLANLANQQKMIAENQAQYLDDFESDRISKANYDMDSSAIITDVYTGKADLKIDEAGNLMFGKDNQFKRYSDIANYSLKATDTANKLLNIADKLAASKYRMNNAALKLQKNRIKSMIEKGGRSELVSLIKDDLLPGFSDLEIPQELYKPENYGKLKDFFLDTMGNALEDVNNLLPKDPRFTENKNKDLKNKGKGTGIKKGKFGGRTFDERLTLYDAAYRLSTGDLIGGSPTYEFSFKIPGQDLNSTKYVMDFDKSQGKIALRKKGENTIYDFYTMDEFLKMIGLEGWMDNASQPGDGPPFKLQEDSEEDLENELSLSADYFIKKYSQEN